MVHVLLKPVLENFEHYFTSVWDECNCVVVWVFLIFVYIYICIWASLVAKLVKNLSQCRRPWFDSWVGKMPWRRDRLPIPGIMCFPGGSDGKESTCNAGDLGLIPRLGRNLEEGMAIHSVLLPGESPWMGDPGRLQLMGSQRVRHDWATHTYVHIPISYTLKARKTIRLSFWHLAIVEILFMDSLR